MAFRNLDDLRRAVLDYCQLNDRSHGPIGDWDVSQVTDMHELFSGCEDFNEPLDSWDVSNVTNMSAMFKGCTHFNQPLGTWNVSNVTDISWMFCKCTHFNQPLGTWNVSNVTNMSGIFYRCTHFNQPLGTWNVSNVTNMSAMFSGCTHFNQPLGTWNVSNVIYMSDMFSGCTHYNQPLDTWNVSNVKDIYMRNYGYRPPNMFANCYNLDRKHLHGKLLTIYRQSFPEYDYASLKRKHKDTGVPDDLAAAFHHPSVTGRTRKLLRHSPSPSPQSPYSAETSPQGDMYPAILAAATNRKESDALFELSEEIKQLKTKLKEKQSNYQKRSKKLLLKRNKTKKRSKGSI